jgi:hypothetical protein
MWYNSTMEYYLTMKRDRGMIPVQPAETLEKQYAEWEKPNTKGHVLYHSLSRKFPNKQIQGESR